MTTTYTLRDFTKIICAAEMHRDEMKLFNQMKGLAARGLMSPIEGYYGPKGALLFPEAEIYRARMLLAAVDVGVSSKDLALLDAHMRANTTRPTLPIGENFTASLDAAITSLPKEDSHWVLEVLRIRSRDTGNIKSSVSWIVNGDRLGRADVFNPDVESLEGPTEAILSIPFNPIARAIWLEIRK
jgi:hypothetical protein